jgi:serine/threonine protein kinase
MPGSVQTVLQQVKTLDEAVIKKYTKQILLALLHLHGAGFVCNSTTSFVILILFSCL